ncbi:MAG: hypothetical protein ACRBN8_21850 [Nannocystales bacterium]
MQQHLQVDICTYLARLSVLERKLADCDTAGTEELAADEAWAHLVPSTDALAESASELFDSLATTGTENIRSEIPAVIPGLAFVAKMEVHRLRKQLSTLSENQPRRHILDGCQRTRRHILRAVTAVANELRGHTPSDTVLPQFNEELGRSLRCRRALSALWHRIDASAGRPLLQRLRLAGAAFATLQGCDAYRDIRVGDRLGLREVQARLLAWLRLPDRSDKRGERLLAATHGFVQVTRGINARAELIEHDDRLIAELIPVLAARPAGTIPPALLSKLVLLQGSKRSLDALLLGDLPLNVETVLPVLRSVNVAAGPPSFT